MVWQCGECGKIHGDKKKVVVKYLPPFLYRIWKILRLNPGNLKNQKFILNLMNSFTEIEEREDGEVVVTARCHHCGKPLCQEHRILILDDAFSVDEEKVRTLLPSWWPKSIELKANKKFRILESQALSCLKNYHPEYKKLKQKAYHCENCWQKYHPQALPEIE